MSFLKGLLGIFGSPELNSGTNLNFNPKQQKTQIGFLAGTAGWVGSTLGPSKLYIWALLATFLIVSAYSTVIYVLVLRKNKEQRTTVLTHLAVLLAAILLMCLTPVDFQADTQEMYMSLFIIASTLVSVCYTNYLFSRKKTPRTAYISLYTGACALLICYLTNLPIIVAFYAIAPIMFLDISRAINRKTISSGDYSSEEELVSKHKFSYMSMYLTADEVIAKKKAQKRNKKIVYFAVGIFISLSLIALLLYLFNHPFINPMFSGGTTDPRHLSPLIDKYGIQILGVDPSEELRHLETVVHPMSPEEITRFQESIWSKISLQNIIRFIVGIFVRHPDNALNATN
ncbi:hypothetical protein NEOKW01_1770 [Nematocida sp. AWRm80]|nr:hypothetical protein NEOKW01_1770 [Nematocida sp. AWRm80]